MKELKVKIDVKYTAQRVWPNDWSGNPKRDFNWAAITSLNYDTGDEERVYLKEGEADLDWNVKDVKSGDILAFGLYDRYKPRYSRKAYYKVLDISDDEMVLLSEDDGKGFTTIRKAIRANG
jgi:hypothetical protein